MRRWGVKGLSALIFRGVVPAMTHKSAVMSHKWFSNNVCLHEDEDEDEDGRVDAVSVACLKADGAADVASSWVILPIFRKE